MILITDFAVLLTITSPNVTLADIRTIEVNMNILSNKMVIAIIAIIAGILVLAVPDIIRWVIGILLIIYGVLMLLGKK